jgi:type II secretory ATPase GspE/PulE/Tfp pilus assembly ATPase PilB-like protein
MQKGAITLMSTSQEQSTTGLSLQQQLLLVSQKIHDSDCFFDAMPSLEEDLKKFLECERVTVYSKGRSDKEIVSRFKSGEDNLEIRVPLSPTSISGFVAMSQKAVLLKDVYNDAELKAVHPELQFNRSFDEKSGFRTRSVICVPIKFGEVLLGVLQVLNKSALNGTSSFDKRHLKCALALSKILGQKFRYELKGTKGPYDYLVQTRRIKQEKLDEILERAQKEGSPIHELLISSTGLNRGEIGRSLEQYYQVPFVQYDPHHEINAELASGINAAYLKQQLWVPIRKSEDGEVTVLVDNPNDAQKIMEIQRSLPAKKYFFNIAFPEDILKYLGQGGEITETPTDIHELVGMLQDEVEAIDTDEIDDEVNENAATVIQLVNKFITDAYQSRASDIHIEPAKGKTNASVRFRVDGACRPAFSIPYTHVRAVVSRIKIISGLDISERRKPQDGKCAVRFRGQPIELRVATVPTVHGESVVMRILASSEPLPLDKLNFSARNYTETTRIVESPHGIFLVVGPTGSGKTTTLHAILGHINTPERKIWTAEDPVEITQSGLNQVQMKPEINLTFATALRSFLRADPDVIMIGEMRDHETAHIGVEAALTGHFVFSTLHTNSAAETITRLLDLELDPVSFSDAMQGVLAQRLVRTLCSDCKQSYDIPEDEITLLRRYYGEEFFDELNVSAGTSVFKANGCEKCGNTGYLGRTGIHELLCTSEEIKRLIYEKATATQLKEQAIKEGMRTLMQDGIQKLFLGQTDLVQVRKVAT